MWLPGDNTAIQGYEGAVKGAKDARLPLITDDMLRAAPGWPGVPRHQPAIRCVGSPENSRAGSCWAQNPKDLPLRKSRSRNWPISRSNAAQLGITIPAGVRAERAARSPCMEIVTQQLGDALEVKVKGRLDNYWTEHLRGNLEEIIRGGAHGIRLNLSEISFLSSAGVGLLVKFHTQLKGIGGSFIVTSPSERVKQVLDLCRLSTILLAQTTPVAPPPIHKTEVRRFSSPAGSFEMMECPPGKPLICERIGDPDLLKGCRFGPARLPDGDVSRVYIRFRPGSFRPRLRGCANALW